MAEKRKSGRPKGALDKRSANRRKAIQAGGTPLKFLLEIMYDKSLSDSMRMAAAVSAAPYCHAKLASITVEHKEYDGDPNSISSEQLAAIATGGGRGNVVATQESTKRLN